MTGAGKAGLARFASACGGSTSGPVILDFIRQFVCVTPQMNFGYEDVPYVSLDGTILPRHIAAILDNIIACILAVIAAKQLDETNVILQGTVAVVAYLGYYFLLEATLSRTLGKLLTGLKVMNIDGNRCSVLQTAIRRLFRLIEVNPLLFGALPAAIRIVWTKNRQRFGDKVARTVVVFSRD